MTVIRNNSISGINSITAQSGALNFYDSTGNTLSIGADVTGGVTVATGATISGSTNTIVASTNGSERVRINSSGNIGIGTDNPFDSKLHVFGKQRVSASAKSLTTDFFVLSSNDNSSTRNDLIFRQRASDNDWEIEAVEQNTGYHNVWIKNGNLKFTSGKGIDFSANTATGTGTTTSSILDDYEEGTFTPGIQGTTVGGTASFATANGTYTKVGRLVTIQVFLSWSSGTGSGAMQITGLPFTAASGNRFYAISISDSTVSTSANHILRGRTENGATTIILKEEPIGGGSQQNGTYDSAAQIILSCSYHT